MGLDFKAVFAKTEQVRNVGLHANSKASDKLDKNKRFMQMIHNRHNSDVCCKVYDAGINLSCGEVVEGYILIFKNYVPPEQKGQKGMIEVYKAEAYIVSVEHPDKFALLGETTIKSSSDYDNIKNFWLQKFSSPVDKGSSFCYGEFRWEHGRISYSNTIKLTGQLRREKIKWYKERANLLKKKNIQAPRFGLPEEYRPEILKKRAFVSNPY